MSIHSDVPSSHGNCKKQVELESLHSKDTPVPAPEQFR